MRAFRVMLGAVLFCLLASLLTTVPVSASAAGLSSSVGSAAGNGAPRGAQLASDTRKPQLWTPPIGVLFNDPIVGGRARAILARVIRSIRATVKGETIRIVVWNLDDRPIVAALLDAVHRKVTVQVVVSGLTANHNWTTLREGLRVNRRDDSFARKCHGACRSRAKIMHAKIFMFSRIHKASNISMFGSTNLTTPAGNRQWNDMVTVKNKHLYDFFVKTFNEYAKDRPIRHPFEVYDEGRYRATLFPALDRNPVVAQLRKVACRGATGGTGNPNGRTEIRIAIAGWFDAYGGAIARQLRVLWERGCDIKIVTTLAGRAVNRYLRNPSGRGPVPMREVTIDNNDDGIPERYLHMKAIAVSGVFDGDRAASVVLTGSPNWSTRAQRSDEVWVRLLDRPIIVRQYHRHVDRLYASPAAHFRSVSPRRFGRSSSTAAGGRASVPSWFEMD